MMHCGTKNPRFDYHMDRRKPVEIIATTEENDLGLILK